MFATACIQPIDMLKVRIQLLGEGGTQFATKNPFKLASQVIKNEGVLSL
jgi:solute carrier family 25 oxoglutarate transporter 11